MPCRGENLERLKPRHCVHLRTRMVGTRFNGATERRLVELELSQEGQYSGTHHGSISIPAVERERYIRPLPLRTVAASDYSTADTI